MSSPSRLSPWPQYPNIPIYLDTPNERRAHQTPGSTKQTLQLPTHTPGGRAVHYITVESPIQPEIQSSTASILTPSWKEATRQPRRPILRYLPSADDQTGTNVPDSPANPALNRPRIRLETQPSTEGALPRMPDVAGRQGLPARPRGRFPVVPNEVSEHADSGRPTDSGSGLGIAHGPSNLASIIRSPNTEKDKQSPNVAQRIEKRLWRYNSSGNVVERWLLEIISWSISFISMAAIVGVLFHLQGKRQPHWPLGLTLNAYIAIFSKIASAALVLPISEALGQLKWSWFQGDAKKMWDFEIFDNASRGPWGSFLLLIRTKCKTLAALGAAVTILSLALDPFFQQVLAFPSPERWSAQGFSLIPRVVHYEPNPGTLFQGNLKVAQMDQALQAVAQKFFFDNGTQPIPFGNGTRPDIPLSCPTSNCTWEPYDSLGICSECEDVSDLLTFSCLKTRLDWSTHFAMTGNGSYPNETVCGYFLNATSARPVLMSGYSMEGEALLMRALPLVTNPTRQQLFGGSIHFKHIRNPINDFLIVGAANGTSSVYRNETPIAHECVLSWCVKTFSSSYYWAKYTEKVTNRFLNTTEGPFPWRAISLGNGTDIFYDQNITLDAPSGEFGLSNQTAFGVNFVFDDMFPSYSTVANATATPFLRFRTYETGPPILLSYDFDPWIQNNVSCHLEKLATALTNVVRSSSSNEMVRGIAYGMESYVKVQWAWLSLPLALLFLTLVFLVATVIKSSRERDRVGIWKTSAIATLLYGLPDDMQKKITSTTTGTPRARAKELRVKLVPKTGWRISGNLFSPMPPKIRQNQPPPGWI